MTTPHLDRIDSVRGMAILLVFAYHTLLILVPGFEIKSYDANGIIQMESWLKLILYVTPLGHGTLGVDLFLVISGFLIHLIHLRSGTELNVGKFYSKRFWRIYPPYILILLIFAGLNLDLSPQGFKNTVSHVLMLHNLSDETFFAINPSFWSIALECQLYLIYPVYLFLLKYLGALRTLLFIVVISIAFSAFGVLAGITSLAYGTFVLKYWMIWCAGAHLADRFYNEKRIFNHPFIWVVFSFAVYCTFKSFYVSSKFVLIPATALCVSLMEGMLYYKNESNYLTRILKPIAFLGLCSYSLYLIHQPYLGYLMNLFDLGTSFAMLNVAASMAFAWTLIILVSHGLYKTLELKSISIGQILRSKKITDS